MIKVSLRCKILRHAKYINQVITYERLVYDAEAELAIPLIKERLTKHLIEAVQDLFSYKLLEHQISFLLDKSLSLEDTVDFRIYFSDTDIALLEITYLEVGYTK